MQNLNNDIKNREFRQLYLLYGEEEFLKLSYKKRLKAAITGDDDMNYAYFNGKGADIDAIIDFADTMPFFAEARCIVIEDSGFFKSSADKLVEYIENMPETTHIIFVEDAVDKRNRLYKAVKERGYICELKHPEGRELAGWAAGILAKAGKKITASNMDIFLSYVGDDMERIKNELDKLIAYTGDRDIIEHSDIDTITTISLNNRIFDMVRAITMKRNTEALKLYEDLLALKEPPLKILFHLSRQFTQLLQIKLMMQSGKDKDFIAGSMKLQSFVAGKLMQQAKGYDRAALLAYVRSCVELEEAVKTGSMTDRMAVELLIIGA